MKAFKIFFIASLLLAISCNKKDNMPPSDLVFIGSCNFTTEEIEYVENIQGELEYTGFLRPEWPLPEPVFLIRANGFIMSMQVCNMPSGFVMELEQSRTVTFSGRVVILSEKASALTIPIELSYLKFDE